MTTTCYYSLTLSQPRRWLYAVLSLLFVLILYSTFFGFLSGPKNGSNRGTPYTPPPRVDDGRFHWEDLPIRHPVTSMVSLPTGQPLKLPRIQHPFSNRETPKLEAAKMEERRGMVKEVFERCWNSYKTRAWMHDELAPLSGDKKDPFGGWAATLVDSLDTLWIMGMKDDFEKATVAVLGINFSHSLLERINVFETTIRYLGGFLSAYDLSGDKRLLDKAVEVGEMLYVAFDTPNRMPITQWDHEKAKTEPQEGSEGVNVAEIGSLCLEFTRLSQLTQNMKWFDAVQRITDVFARDQNKTKLPGMWPLAVNARMADFSQGDFFTLGGMADSVYEYLPKMYALLGGLLPQYKDLYERSMDTAMKHNLYRPMTPENTNILLSGAVRVQTEPILEPEGQHLACFTGGMLALGGALLNNATHLDYADRLTRGCIYAYRAFPLGIMPEVFHTVPCPQEGPCQWTTATWHAAILERTGGKHDKSVEAIIAEERLPPGFTAVSDRRYWLRPEAIESVFILYRVTGSVDLLDLAFDMWSAISNYTKTDIANAGLWDMTVPDPPKADTMESYWMAETLKYFYLIFSDPSVLSLDEYVFNTEAHPFKRPR